MLIDDLTKIIDRFLASERGRLAQARWRLLLELMSIYIEFRWRAASADGEPILEQYVSRFPKLGAIEELPAETVLEEYRVRCR